MEKELVSEVLSYKCNWCAELYDRETSACQCAFDHAKEKLAISLLDAGYTLDHINHCCGFRWQLKDEQKNITKEDCFKISWWQCCEKPAYRIVSINAYGSLKLWGKGSWSGYYGNYISLSELPISHNKNKYSPTERSVELSADNEAHAEYLVQSRFGSLQKPEGVKALKAFLIPSKKSQITIQKTEEIASITPKTKKGEK